MQYFANPSTPLVREAMLAGKLGCILTPKQGNVPLEGVPWVADNGCFGKGYPGDEAWFAWLTKHSVRAGTCLFAVAPDVVGDATATLARSAPWLQRIRDLGYPAAFVGQDGLEHHDVPWDSFDAFFIGGTTEWKMGRHAHLLTIQAKCQGKHVHMGRVNSLRRLMYARVIEVDSADGTFISFGPTKRLPEALSWVDMVNRPTLFD